MGLVIKAHNLDLDEHVAIKLLREDVELDEDGHERFVREAKNAVKLKSEHVARIRDVGTMEDGRPYMVMELLEGLDLGKIVLDQGALERTRAVDLLLQACDAIAEAHALGIVHRDIKPTNLFVTKRRDGTDLLKVLDFGISKAQMGTDMSLTQTQSMLGTPAYMSPEQMRSARSVDPRSDIWSLGCVLYELCEGRLAFDAENFAELCVMVATEQFAPMEKAPELTPVIQRALAKTLETRYQDVADLAFALEPYASDPERAYRQVVRVFRMLGRTHPEGRDSTPIPISRATQSRPSHPAFPQVPIAPPALKTGRGGTWQFVAMVSAILGVLIGLGIFAFDGADEQTQQPAVDEIEQDVADPGPERTLARDAAIETTSADATASAVAAPPVDPVVKKPPPKKPPRKQPPKPPPKPQPVITQPPKPQPPPKPPKPKCDPFDNPKGCD
jgi:serine/threonine-protein kinase